MIQAGDTLTLRLPNGTYPRVTIVSIEGRLLDTVIIRFADGTQDALHVSTLAQLRVPPPLPEPREQWR